MSGKQEQYKTSRGKWLACLFYGDRDGKCFEKSPYGHFTGFGKCNAQIVIAGVHKLVFLYSTTNKGQYTCKTKLFKMVLGKSQKGTGTEVQSDSKYIRQSTEF